MLPLVSIKRVYFEHKHLNKVLSCHEIKCVFDNIQFAKECLSTKV